MEIKNLKKAASRILKAIKAGENIILYGDADLDGMASVIILKEAIQNLGGKVKGIYFPDREIEGYGITEKGLGILKKFAPALLVALDLGIGNFKEVKLAKKLGFEVIIVDHHEILDRLPSASIVIDPKQKGDKYSFKKLATAAIAFKLAQFLLKGKITEELRKNFLELAALATLADMMPREKENELLIEEGLEYLDKSWRPGIQTIFRNSFFKKFPSLEEKISKFISILNVRDVEKNLPVSFRLLDASSSEKVEKIMEKLIEKNEQRREKIRDIVEEAEKKISKREEEGIIFEGDSDWDFILISATASILCQRYKKPTFIFKKMKKESQGTVRTPSGVNGVSLMKKCKKLLLTYGGHPQASGFRVKNENLERFKKCLIKNFY